jgi:hypothetical protein
MRSSADKTQVASRELFIWFNLKQRRGTAMAAVNHFCLICTGSCTANTKYINRPPAAKLTDITAVNQQSITASFQDFI